MKYRIGRKQRLALLTIEGSREVAMFNTGQEELAQLVCDLLNKHSANTPVIKSVCGDCWGSGWETQFVKPCTKCNGTGKC